MSKTQGKVISVNTEMNSVLPRLSMDHYLWDAQFVECTMTLGDGCKAGTYWVAMARDGDYHGRCATLLPGGGIYIFSHHNGVKLFEKRISLEQVKNITDPLWLVLFKPLNRFVAKNLLTLRRKAS